MEKNINCKILLRNRRFGDFFSKWNRQLSLEKKIVQERGPKRLLYWPGCIPKEQTSVEKNINRKISLRNRPFGGFFRKWNR